MEGRIDLLRIIKSEYLWQPHYRNLHYAAAVVRQPYNPNNLFILL